MMRTRVPNLQHGPERRDKVRVTKKKRNTMQGSDHANNARNSHHMGCNKEKECNDARVSNDRASLVRVRSSVWSPNRQMTPHQLGCLHKVDCAREAPDVLHPNFSRSVYPNNVMKPIPNLHDVKSTNTHTQTCMYTHVRKQTSTHTIKHMCSVRKMVNVRCLAMMTHTSIQTYTHEHTPTHAWIR